MFCDNVLDNLFGIHSFLTVCHSAIIYCSIIKCWMISLRYMTNGSCYCPVGGQWFECTTWAVKPWITWCFNWCKNLSCFKMKPHLSSYKFSIVIIFKLSIVDFVFSHVPPVPTLLVYPVTCRPPPSRGPSRRRWPRRSTAPSAPPPRGPRARATSPRRRRRRRPGRWRLRPGDPSWRASESKKKKGRVTWGEQLVTETVWWLRLQWYPFEVRFAPRNSAVCGNGDSPSLNWGQRGHRTLVRVISAAETLVFLRSGIALKEHLLTSCNPYKLHKAYTITMHFNNLSPFESVDPTSIRGGSFTHSSTFCRWSLPIFSLSLTADWWRRQPVRRKAVAVWRSNVYLDVV